MSKSKKLNRDHAKKTQRPMIEDEVIANQLADELALPTDRISLEMIYHGLYHFSVAHQKGLACDPIQYFTAPENQDLGIVKSI